MEERSAGIGFGLWDPNGFGITEMGWVYELWVGRVSFGFFCLGVNFN